MRYYWYHHPVFYRRLLWGGLAVLLLCGLLDAKTKVLSQAATAGTPHAIATALTTYTPKTASVPTTKMATQPRPTARLASASEPLPPYGPVGTATVATESASGDVQVLARSMSAAKFGDGQWPALKELWMHESGFRPTARNARSGACGIPQALPCRKIPDMSTAGQIDWGLDYIAARYGDPSSAWRFWQAHHWY